jgi:hypothetical protein
MTDDMEPVLQEPLKLVVVHGRAATAHMVDVPKVKSQMVAKFAI